MNSRRDAAFAAIDEANAADPTVVTVRGVAEPLALVHGRLACEWVAKLDGVDDAVMLAARAHHLRRWQVPRTSYPEGRPGYLRWRRDQKARHASDVAEILQTSGYDLPEIEQVQVLIRRERLGHDPQAQLVQDAACLVFLETQLADMALRTEHDKLLSIVRKTAAKMSPAAVALVAQVPLSGDAIAVLNEAFATAVAAYVVVVGGVNLDTKAAIAASIISGTSNPGVTVQAPGGVGRNIAENVARLGTPVVLLSAVGDDSAGVALLQQCAAVGVDTQYVLQVAGQRTGTYTAVLDHQGELVVAVADMAVMDQIDANYIRQQASVLRSASWVIADGNLGPDALCALLALCRELGVPVIVDPVSVAKSAHLLAALESGFAPQVVTPNIDELAALAGMPVAADTVSIVAAAAALVARGVGLVWVRRGGSGSVLCSADQVFEVPAQPAEVRDVTGAGDAMVAGFVVANMNGASPQTAARQAHAAAAITVESTATVAPEMTLSALTQRLNLGIEP